MQNWSRCRTGLGCWVMALSVLVAGCGGGGGSTPPPPPQATALPDSVTITAPASSESASAVKFGSSAAPLAGYRYRWDFGDGAQSSEAAPSHGYVKGGDFEVVLTLSNEAGQKREARSTVSITNLANVQGLTCSGASSAGWCIQTPRPTGQLQDSFMWDTHIGWAITSQGKIFKTVDGGSNWETQTAPVTGYFRSVRFFDANSGWILGDGALALRTSDGGRNWIDVRLNSGELNPAGTFRAVSATTAYFFALRDQDPKTYAYLNAYATSDRGVTWRRLAPAPTHVAQGDVYWVLGDRAVQRSTDAGLTLSTTLDFDRAGIATSPSDNRLIVHPGGQAAALLTRERITDPATGRLTDIKTTITTTADGGSTWRSQSPSCTTTVYCFDLLPLSISSDGQTLLGSRGLGSIFRSVDAGKTWEQAQDIDPSYYYVALNDGANIAVARDSNPLFGAFSRDGGKSFTKFSTPAGIGSIGGVLQLQSATGYLMYIRQGTLWLSKDHGANWEQIITSIGAGEDYLYFNEPPTVAMLNAKHGFIKDTFGVVRETFDGGRTVSRANPTVMVGALKLQFVNDKVGWFSKYDTATQVSTLYRTEDGGQTWALVSSQPGYRVDFRFETDKTGWIRAPFPFRSPPLESERGYTFQVTQDGGQTWQAVQVPSGTYDLRLAPGSGRWVASGERGLLATSTSSGASWTVVPALASETLATLAASDTGTWWALGTSALLTSRDGGATWAQASFACAAGGLKDIAFASSKVGWVVCDQAIMATTDGGVTWRAQPYPALSWGLSKVYVSDTKTAWVAGPKNILLATGSGGQ